MAKRWTIPFVSRQSKQCRIDIYDPSWSGAVTELSTNNANSPGVAAEDPFYFEEDDDEDLLRVVRYKTGYINLIETTFGGLDDLYATTAKNRYVEVYYNSYLVFRGYIQPQTFENDWSATPREVNLPVISPLGLLDGNWTFTPEQSVADKNIGYYMKKIINAVNFSEFDIYQTVTFPNMYSDGCPDFLGTIRSTVACEDNPDFSQALASSNPYKGINFMEFLEGICNAFGWICHDMPGYILFTKFDHEGAYYYKYVNVLDQNSYNDDVTDDKTAPLDISNFLSPSSDDAKVTLIRPLRLVAVSGNGEALSSIKAEFKRTAISSSSPIYTYLHNDNEEYIVFLQTCGDYPEVTGDHLLTGNTLNDYSPVTNGMNIVDHNGTIKLCMKNMTSWTAVGGAIATLYFYERPIMSDSNQSDGKLYFRAKISAGYSLISLGDSQWTIGLTFTLYCGDTLIGTFSSAYILGETEIDIPFENVPNNGALRLVISRYGDSTAEGCLLAFESMELHYKEAIYSKYLFRPTVETMIGDTANNEEGSVEMLMSCQFDDSNAIYPLKSTFFTYYHYLRDAPQTRLQIRMRNSGTWPLYVKDAYIKHLKYFKDAWRWRLIALAFHPWDDEWTLTLHHSTTIDS